ncbi:tRNA (adenosine(37)-N6)-threonylcarbamoyltransferase complex dimerization subunit type 1 TsaB [Lysinibacter sp. HNR]|uniref:tRNA (adenosine(37)-N6)-threonylcarbamoyltransferase complex dimerization subunit type 1 TsaB n=1 Tax=Lysinibacter sp. HNR TaxID=3031408 RepID=UPI002435FC72|nr:tRNA (adenosine(37)-N6)-threonylcarbamoyltransferase complex dimerization subunit type 1 TsaB [Lysinibacter sp. HNR]WGD36703.1 tRNA (adenosine(37)-N6)-threonylcarbamoyltransferase complex dimerization subunit type 1 TsaB [Lysinibacter sp. HNR]
MVLLAIDTSLGTSVGVKTGSGDLYDAVSEDAFSHAEAIGDLIRRVLNDAGVHPAQITGVINGVGPGPYTGLRVGIAAAQAFAAGRGVPLESIVSHDAIAWDQPVTLGEDLVVVTDARRREVYWSRYTAVTEGGMAAFWERKDGPVVTKPDQVPSGIPTVDGNRVGLRATSLIERADLMRTRGSAFETGEALYLRSPDVTLSRGPKRVTA